MMIDFDNIDDWAPVLTTKLEPLITEAALDEVLAVGPKESIAEVCHRFRSSTYGKALRDAAIEWVGSVTIAGYHGTRLTEAEVDSIRTNGLQLLNAESRRSRLQRALSNHERWWQVAENLDAALQDLQEGQWGEREGQTHLTLSRTSLSCGLTKYLTYGSEADRHVAHELLGREGVELLAKDGEPRLITVAVPGDKALAAANPHFTVEHCLAWDRDVNLVCEFLACWTFRRAYPSFQSRSLQLDCGMHFKSIVPPHWITSIETLQCQ